MVVLAAGRVEPNPPVMAKPLDAATQARINAFLSSGVGLKFTQQAQPYKAELDRQSAPYLCAKFVRHGFARSCAELGIPER